MQNSAKKRWRRRRGRSRGRTSSSLAYVAAIQSPHEQSPSYKYSDPAVVLMSKVYQTTDSIHVEKATLLGNSPTNRDRAGVCLSIIMGWRERARGSERETAYHHSLCIAPTEQSRLHIVRIKIIVSLKKKNTLIHSYVINRQINDLLWAEYRLVSFRLCSLSMHQ